MEKPVEETAPNGIYAIRNVYLYNWFRFVFGDNALRTIQWDWFFIMQSGIFYVFLDIHFNPVNKGSVFLCELV